MLVISMMRMRMMETRQNGAHRLWTIGVCALLLVTHVTLSPSRKSIVPMLKITVNRVRSQNGREVGLARNIRFQTHYMDSDWSRSTTTGNTRILGYHLVSYFAKLTKHLVRPEIIAQKLRR